MYLNSGVPYIQTQTRKHLEAVKRKKKFVGPLFANGSAAAAKRLVSANYTMYSADAAVLEAEKAFIRSRSEANLEQFKKRERRAFARRKIEQDAREAKLLADRRYAALLAEMQAQQEEEEEEEEEDEDFFAFTY